MHSPKIDASPGGYALQFAVSVASVQGPIRGRTLEVHSCRAPYPRNLTACRRTVLTVLLAGTLCSPLFRLEAVAQSPGKFRGRVVAEWLPDGRAMKLVQAFAFTDAEGNEWVVPADVVVDGASIPRVFWSVIGGPFEGNYRDASVIHDYYCVVRTRPSAQVHRVFHHAMLAAGVKEQKAWLMYQAVSNFGPKWSIAKIDPKCSTVREDYDFDKCALNSARPPITWPTLDKGQLQDFLATVEKDADPEDITLLRRSISGLK